MKKEDCIFCRIVNGEIPAKKVHEDEHFLVFHDLNPVAPVHVLIVPKAHYKNALSLAEQADAESEYIGTHLFPLIAILAQDLNIEKGFRLINNCGKEGGQSIMHLHFHLIGGADLGMKLI